MSGRWVFFWCLLGTGVAIAQPVMPKDMLPAGVDSNVSVNPYTGESHEARKGTIAATIQNVVFLNQALSQNEKNVEAYIQALRDLMPSLSAVGLFDFFTPQEWIDHNVQPGRTLCAVLYFQTYPERLTPEIKNQLKAVRQKTQSKVLASEIDKVLG